MRFLICAWLLLGLLVTGPAGAQTVALGAGWTPLAFPVKSLTSLDATGVAGIVFFDGTAYQARGLSLAELNAEGGTFRGFWAYCAAGGQIRYSGSSTGASSLTVRQGWNLVAFPESAGLALSQLRGGGSLLLYAAGATTPLSGDARLQPGQAYWLYATQAGSVEWGAAASTPNLYVAIFTHNEDQPDFVNDKAIFTIYRNSIIEFAKAMKARNLVWNWQSDWSFLNAVLRFEVAERDSALLAATGGQNIVAWLKSQGAEIDPHSHEKMGYNYADVAYLITQTGVEPSPVVGGHIWDPAEPTWSNWPEFIDGLRGSRFPSYTFNASLLMGAGTPNHRNDPVATGIWKPASGDAFFTHSASQTLASWGGWDNDLTQLDALISQVASLDRNGMWTASYIFTQGNLATPGYLAATVIPQLDALAAQRDAGRLNVVQFMPALEIWRTRYGGQGFIYRKS